MSDTTATVRAEILEEEKRKIDERIEHARACRAEASNMYVEDAWDKIIDSLLLQKDNLSACVPAGWIETAEEKRVRLVDYEISALENRRAEHLRAGGDYHLRMAEGITEQIESIRKNQLEEVAG